ncbi:MAG: SAM-dependent methyltransferase [Alphaproteobacteria bacterium]|nr:MAG: SAM-dependent methyltransferase [Alphaproteobacteria bacterium]
MQSQSRQVSSQQEGLHEGLDKVVRRHLGAAFRRPVAAHTQAAFDRVAAWLALHPRPFILDACCGVGDSSRALAELNPDHLVVGVDKSADRLGRERTRPAPDNLLLVRADLNDFYRLAEAARWRPAKHFILYPNPWPKPAHLKRRWHGAPVFPSIIALGGALELRSNWDIYLREFAAALAIAGHDSRLESFEATDPITPFERKYRDSGHTLWRLTADLGK